jgi:uncharacterized membrane protein YraQ (UPF0718 family)
MLSYVKDILMAIMGYLKADWYILLIGTLFAVAINVYVDSSKLKKLLKRRAGISIPGAVALGALTPLCACGTMAVLFSMFASAMPWGTVMAFLISSPLTSPSEYMFETAFFGSKFALGILLSSLILGIASGIIAHILENRTKFFKDQFRLVKQKVEGCSCSEIDESATSCDCNAINEITETCSCSGTNTLNANYKIQVEKQNCGCEIGKVTCNKKVTFIRKYKIDKFIKEFWNIGIKKILLYFVIFIAIGRVVESLIPKELIMTLFGSSKAYSIPLAATIGLPLYLTDSSAMPLLKSFINSGAGEGAVLAFIIAGKATGAPVIAGLATFLKKRAMLFYIGFIYFGAILSGYIYQVISSIRF